MKREAAAILNDALALTTEARAALAGLLLESLDTELDAEVAWAIEVNRCFDLHSNHLNDQHSVHERECSLA